MAIQVEDGKVKVALGKFALNLKQKAALLKEIGVAQIRSVYQTFDDQGSPEGSWAPLAPATLRNSASKATAGRKILILSGRLRNSIQASSDENSVVIGTNVVYARVQQLGSGELPSKVPGHTRKFLREIHYGTREVLKDGKAHQVPVAMRTGFRVIEDARGRKTTVRASFQGPRLLQDVAVEAHERSGGIPARPYLVFRPEDPERIRGQVEAFVERCASQSGLQGGAH